MHEEIFNTVHCSFANVFFVNGVLFEIARCHAAKTLQRTAGHQFFLTPNYSANIDEKPADCLQYDSFAGRHQI